MATSNKLVQAWAAQDFRDRLRLLLSLLCVGVDEDAIRRRIHIVEQRHKFQFVISVLRGLPMATRLDVNDRRSDAVMRFVSWWEHQDLNTKTARARRIVTSMIHNGSFPDQLTDAEVALFMRVRANEPPQQPSQRRETDTVLRSASRRLGYL